MPASKPPDFRAEITNAQTVVHTLKGISNSKKDQHCIAEITSSGLKFTVTETSISSQGIATINERLFDVWLFSTSENQNPKGQSRISDDAPGNSISFRINLNTLLQCLSSLGTANLQHTDLKMAYFSSEECFSLQLLEGQVLTECKIRTIAEDINSEERLHIDDSQDVDQHDDQTSRIDFAVAFRNSPVVNKGIIKSELLRDAFHELAELPGAATVTVLMSPRSPYFQLSAQGQTASCKIDFPHGGESFTQLTCERELSYNYRLSLLQQSGKALVFSDKSFIRMNEEGTLSIQHMLLHPDGQKTYVDYYILADVDEGDSVASPCSETQIVSES